MKDLTLNGLLEIQSIRNWINWRLTRDIELLQEELLEDILDRNEWNQTSDETFERMLELKKDIREWKIAIKLLDRQIEINIEQTKK